MKEKAVSITGRVQLR